MAYLEMARDEDHGGGAWGFTNCVWAPTRKENGQNWTFWKKVSEVREGDIVFHLRGATPHARFVGYSIAACNGFETSSRPPNPGKWAFSNHFYRANLRDFTPFHEAIKLSDVFTARSAELEAYLDKNQTAEAKLNVFFVKQAGRLQCLNGAYFSDLDEELLIVLFGQGEAVRLPNSGKVAISIETGTQISIVRARIGQARFAESIKDLYRNRCCFPACPVEDRRFLVGAHIARWSDNQNLRGNLGNGLCLCLMHDRAFEAGLFTLDQNFNIYVNPRELASESWVVRELVAFQGQQIRLASTLPLEDAILEHWIRVGLEP